MRKMVVIIALIAAAGMIFYQRYSGMEKIERPEYVEVSGNIEAREIQVSFKIPGRVEKRYVDEGERVKARQLIATLEQEEYLYEVLLREAELRVSEAALADLEAGPRTDEIKLAEIALMKARAEAERLGLESERLRKLAGSRAVAVRDFELAEIARRVGDLGVVQAERQLELLKEGSRKETVAQARARVDLARAALGLARTKYEFTYLRSPATGVVLAENIEPGEQVQPGTPVITIGVTDRVWLRAYIDESDLGKVKPGQRALVTVDSYPEKKYEGHVSFISSEAEFTPKNVQTKKERVKLVYRIKIDLPNEHGELKPGMPADARIEI